MISKLYLAISMFASWIVSENLICDALNDSPFITVSGGDMQTETDDNEQQPAIDDAIIDSEEPDTVQRGNTVLVLLMSILFRGVRMGVLFCDVPMSVLFCVSHVKQIKALLTSAPN